MTGVLSAGAEDVSSPGNSQACVLHGLIPDVDEVAEVRSHKVEGVPGLILEAGSGALLLGVCGDQFCVVVLGLLQTSGVMRVKMLGVKYSSIFL